MRQQVTSGCISPVGPASQVTAMTFFYVAKNVVLKKLRTTRNYCSIPDGITHRR